MFCSLSPFALDGILENALREDVGTGDITTLSTISPDRTVTGKYIAKESGVICGLDVVRRVFALLDPSFWKPVYRMAAPFRRAILSPLFAETPGTCSPASGWA